MVTKGTGWIPDIKDTRDLHPEHSKVKEVVKRYLEVKLPPSVNLEDQFGPMYDQGSTNSCTANAIAALVTYFEKKNSSKEEFVAPSRMFLYKVTRNLSHSGTNTGLYLRTTMEALILFGVPLESYWQFNPALLDIEPPSFIYSMARSYRAERYLRLDPEGIKRELLLERIKKFLVSKIPIAFGFYLFESIEAAKKSGNIPYPGDDEKTLGGHAVVAVGYDDNHEILNPKSGRKTKGAFRIRNSWGYDWGENGYGWLPYEYVLDELALDWWTLLEFTWFNSNQKDFLISGKKEQK